MTPLANRFSVARLDGGEDRLVGQRAVYFTRGHSRSAASQFITTVIGAEFSSSALRLTRTR